MRGKLGLCVVVMIAVGLACSVTGYATAPLDPIRVGVMADFPPGSVTPIDLSARFLNPDTKAEVSHVPVILVHDAQTDTLIAYYAREPRSGCLIVPKESDVGFDGYCMGTQYTPSGDCVGGPCKRDLDQFGVVISEDDTVSVDLGDFQQGALSEYAGLQ